MRVHSNSHPSATAHAGGSAHGASQATPADGVTPPFAAAMAEANAAGAAPKTHKVGGATHVAAKSTATLSHATTTSLARAAATPPEA